MFVRLKRPMRRKAGWFAALLYLLCVFAPGAALALGSAASCLPAEVQATAIAHMHGDVHASHHADAGHAMAEHAGHNHTQHQHDGKNSPGPCCAMLCLSAIPAEPPAVGTPARPISVRVSENFQRLPGKAPPLLYRPPIA